MFLALMGWNLDDAAEVQPLDRHHRARRARGQRGGDTGRPRWQAAHGGLRLLRRDDRRAHGATPGDGRGHHPDPDEQHVRGPRAHPVRDAQHPVPDDDRRAAHGAGPARAHGHLLAEHPHVASSSSTTRTSCPSAVEEMLRYESAICPARVVTEDVVVNGVQLRAGDKILIPFGCGQPRPGEVRRPRRGRPDPRAQPAPRVRRRQPPLRRVAPRAARAAGRVRGDPPADAGLPARPRRTRRSGT